MPSSGGLRSGPVLTALGALVALWLGLTAPDVSPVAPSPAQVTPAAVTPATGVPAVVPAPLPQRRGGR